MRGCLFVLAGAGDSSTYSDSGGNSSRTFGLGAVRGLAFVPSALEPGREVAVGARAGASLSSSLPRVNDGNGMPRKLDLPLLDRFGGAVATRAVDVRGLREVPCVCVAWRCGELVMRGAASATGPTAGCAAGLAPGFGTTFGAGI